MNKKASHILLTLVFIVSIKTSFWISNAFLWDDLGLNLYNQIDGGIIELESNEYSYEMKGQKKSGKIEDWINKILKNKWFRNCKISESLSESDIAKISSWDIALLNRKLSNECKSTWGKSISTSTINSLQSQIKDYKNNAQKKAIEKAKQTYNISRIGLYADWNAKNSPFDIVQDIKDIDTIIFTQAIEYSWENPINDWWFSDYLKWKFKDIPKKLTADINWDTPVEDTTDTIADIIAENENNPINEADIVESVEEIKADIEPFPVAIFWEDNTRYACINNVESSGLTQEYLNSLWINNWWHEATSNISILGWFWNSSEANWSGDTDYIEALNEEIALLNTWYKAINDNSSWKCSNFFCITVDFLTSKHSVFGWEKMNSIQSIMEKSNEHLKKFVNTSLVQSKMTTNNFELWLRDLKLSEIFSFGMVITKKTPPILNIEKHEKSLWENPLSAKNIFCKRWESTGWKCSRQNDLEIFVDSDAEAKSIIDSWDLTVVEAAQKFAQREAQQQTQRLMDEFITQAIQRDAWLKQTDELYQEFLEIERFVASIQDYSNDLNTLVKVMNEIPIHP